MFQDYKSLTVKDVLVIRSSAKLLPVVVEELRNTYPEARIDMLATGGGEQNLHMNNVWTTPHTTGFLWRDVFAVRRMLKERSYDLALVLYNAEKGFGYLNVDTLALAAAPKVILSSTINRKVTQLTWPTYIYKCIHRMLDLVWTGVNLIITLVVMICIMLAMVISSPVVGIKKAISRKL